MGCKKVMCWTRIIFFTILFFCWARSKKQKYNQLVCWCTTATNHFCDDILPLFLDGGNVVMGPGFSPATISCFWGDERHSFLNGGYAGVGPVILQHSFLLFWSWYFLQGKCCHARSKKSNQCVHVDAATTSHFCGDFLPSFLEGSDAGIGPADFYIFILLCIAFWLTCHLSDAGLIAGYYLFVCDMHFAIQHIYFWHYYFSQAIFPQAIAALLAVNQN